MRKNSRDGVAIMVITGGLIYNDKTGCLVDCGPLGVIKVDHPKSKSRRQRLPSFPGGYRDGMAGSLAGVKELFEETGLLVSPNVRPKYIEGFDLEGEGNKSITQFFAIRLPISTDDCNANLQHDENSRDRECVSVSAVGISELVDSEDSPFNEMNRSLLSYVKHVDSVLKSLPVVKQFSFGAYDTMKGALSRAKSIDKRRYSCDQDLLFCSEEFFRSRPDHGYLLGPATGVPTAVFLPKRTTDQAATGASAKGFDSNDGLQYGNLNPDHNAYQRLSKDRRQVRTNTVTCHSQEAQPDDRRFTPPCSSVVFKQVRQPKRECLNDTVDRINSDYEHIHQAVECKTKSEFNLNKSDLYVCRGNLQFTLKLVFSCEDDAKNLFHLLYEKFPDKAGKKRVTYFNGIKKEKFPCRMPIGNSDGAVSYVRSSDIIRIEHDADILKYLKKLGCNAAKDYIKQSRSRFDQLSRHNCPMANDINISRSTAGLTMRCGGGGD